MVNKKTLGQLINEFDNSSESTVRQFNELFINCTLLQDNNSIVDIGKPVRCSSDYQMRELTIDGEKIEHNMHVHIAAREEEETKEYINEIYGISINNFDVNIFEEKIAVSEEEQEECL
jgi:hypothetical protein